MSDMSDLDLTAITPEQFATLVAQTPVDQLTEAVGAVGAQPVLDRIFEGMCQRFVPERAGGVNATVQFLIAADDEHSYVLTIADGTIASERARKDAPTVTLSTDLGSFMQLVAGQAQGPALFMQGKLKISGDLMFASRIMSFFHAPTPA